MQPESDALLDPIAGIAREAGRKILEIYETDFEVTDKADESPLTEADMAAHHTIVESLGELTPDIPVLSEESADIPWDERRRWTTYWLVDPLDGTREFIKKNGEFTVNIALVERGIPLLGVVHAPALGRTYLGCDGVGAFRQDTGDSNPRPIFVEPLVDAPVRVVASRSHRDADTEAVLERLGPHEVVSMGSSLKFCLVAEGKADFYPRMGPTSEWDTAAAHAVVEAAGGRVCRMDMQPLRYNTRENLLNPRFIVYGDRKHDWSKYMPDDE